MAVKAPKKPGYSHDPDAVLDYPFNWAEWLEPINDTIVTATVEASTITDDTTPVDVSLVTNDATSVTAWVSGGTLGNTYTLTCRIVTTDGRTEDQSATLVIQEH